MQMPTRPGSSAPGYQLHTNRELGMMLRRQKPLAVFIDGEDVFPASVLRYLRMFDRHAQAGRLVRREHRFAANIHGTDRVLLTILYALPDEAWRIDEMIGLHAELWGEKPWTEDHERMEGMLLGYTDDENNAWIAHLHGQA